MRSTLLVLVSLIAFLVAGCSFLRSTADDAKSAVIDCTKGELANLKPIAASMVKPLTSGALTWDDVKQAAIKSGARLGGCLAAHLHDLFPKPLGFVGEPSQAELVLVDLRAATRIDTLFKTESGTH